MEELPNLDDDVIADWLIPSSEIGRSKRWLKSTPEYHIYKADWFGDVLVYEPTRPRSNPKTKTDWKELNELRLIAHENILLFMAAVESDELLCSAAPAALVMEKAHQRSVQLSKLLHETACRCHQPSSISYHRYHQSSQNSSGNVSPLSSSSSSCSPSPVIGPSGSPSHADRFNWNLSERLSPRGTADSFARYGNGLSPQISPNCSNVRPQHHQQYAEPHKYMRLDVEAKLNICQQVTNAMTYLHDRNYVHKNLTSVNIYIEQNQRVKISLIDNDEQGLIITKRQQPTGQSDAMALPKKRTDDVSFNRVALTYLSPELVKSIRLNTTAAAAAKESNDDEQQLAGQHYKGKECNETTTIDIDTSLKTKAADIYSFGTLMFELFAERYPFSRCGAELATTDCKSAALQSPSQRSMTSSPLDRTTGKTTMNLTTPYLPPPTSAAAASLRSSSSLTGRVFFDDSMIPNSDNNAQSFTQLLQNNNNNTSNNSLLNFSTQQFFCLRQHSNHNHCNQTGNIFEASAAELIYQIGSGWIEDKNLHNGHPQSHHIPPHVKRFISSCWSYKPEERPQFKDFSFI